MADLLKLVDVIQEVQVLPGQSLASSPVVAPVGRRRQRSEAGEDESTGSVLSLESGVFSRGPTRDTLSENACADRQPTADSLEGLERSKAFDALARRKQGHRGRRPAHADTGIIRELGRASSASCLHKLRINVGMTPTGVHRKTKLPRKGLPPRQVDRHLNTGTTGRRGRASWRRNLRWALGNLSRP